jgi:hypothetical protein
MVKSLSVEMEKLKLEGRQTNRNPQDFGNRNNFRRQNNTPQITQRDQRNREDHKVQTPLQNNLVDEQEGDNEETDQEIHCLGDIVASPHLTQSYYEESLMRNQLNELSKGEKVNETHNKYNLRSKQKEGKPSTSNQPKKPDTPPKTMVAPNKGTEEENNQPIIKALVQETKEILKSQSYFNFENEI